MPSPDFPLDYVDYTSISFPSDRISLLAVRRAHPDEIDIEDPENFFSTDHVQHTLGTVIYVERLLARAAYEKAIGKPGNILQERGLSRQDCIKDLAAWYVKYGVCSGRKQTELLIREVEKQAAGQASGKGR